MGKKNKIKTTKLNLGGKSLIEFHTASLNKHGELRGKNKKETKVLKDTCMHHMLGKKGKLKSRVDIDSETKMAHCTMCDHDFRAVPYEKEEAQSAVGDFIELTDHTKMMAASVKVDEDTQRVLAEADVVAHNVYKINRKLTKIVQKEDRVKGKKKKNKDNISSEFGSWSIRR